MNTIQKKLKGGVMAVALVGSVMALGACGTSDGYSSSYSVGVSSYSGDYPTRRDRDGDGIPNRYDTDRDGDGVPNRYDWNPNNPRWR
jgi:hypothetical protein